MKVFGSVSVRDISRYSYNIYHPHYHWDIYKSRVDYWGTGVMRELVPYN